jgi:hypothetical protein
MGQPSDLVLVVEAVVVDSHGDDEQYVAFLTVFDDDTQLPDTVAAWIHAACRHHLGLRPFRARRRPDWTWPT